MSGEPIDHERKADKSGGVAHRYTRIFGSAKSETGQVFKVFPERDAHPNRIVGRPAMSPCGPQNMSSPFERISGKRSFLINQVNHINGLLGQCASIAARDAAPDQDDPESEQMR
ncbi:hypothetical protein [Massilia putida]|uniref:hypothetical protein n=1 Tax=Massilia putida TaxID=1141883 RepID=UPI0012EB23A7|nr:hypothetical protein [Massilia putida]